ncbi:type 1 glutamine amidotransferase domain-containing protein [Lysobacter sp. D1-1-M9]|uniref:type 1 glutamine amidotransferase domain-containing protein n=1 Tax=Novilysobacter longmucuonensis TaxID=3098603 RepID=UPI002FCC7519
MWRRIKLGLVAVVGLTLLLTVTGYAYVRSLDLDSQPVADPRSRPADLAFVRDGVRTPRGKVLAVVTSTEHIGDTGKRAGFELTELSRAYYVFLANGYAVDIASPLGGKPPMVLDDGLVAADYAFLNDPVAQHKLARTLPLAQVDPAQYAAVYFVGGKGTMFDFPGNPDIQRIVRAVYQRGGVVGAVCHGPAALLNVTLDDGQRLLAGKRITGFSNAEELFLLKNARELFPYLLQDRITQVGARFVEGPLYLDTTVVDGRLVTGQNPWSTWSVAETMVQTLGHVPVARERTHEELAVQVLASYYRRGPTAAAQAKARWPQADKKLLLMHAFVAAIQGRVGDAYRMQDLARQ